MKKTLSLVLVVLMVVACFSAFAVAASADDGYTFEDGVLTVSSNIDKGFNESIGRDQYPWGASNSNLRDQIKKVVVTDGVTLVGKYAFANCPNLKEVVLGKDVTEIKDGAFKNSTALETITFGGPLKTAGKDLLTGNTALKTVNLMNQGEAQFVQVIASSTGNVKANGGVETGFDTCEYVENGDTTPEAPEVKKLTIAPQFGVIENWPLNSDNQVYDDGVNEEGKPIYGTKTYFIVGIEVVGDDNSKTERKNLQTQLKLGYAALRVCITDETAGKIYYIDNYAFDTCSAREFYNVGEFYRLAVCYYGIVPESSHRYTVSLEFYDPTYGFAYARGTSDEGAFANSTNDTFTSGGALVPETVPHTCELVDEDPIAAGSTVVVPTETVAIKITPKFGKWENWVNSPNNPNGVGQEPGVTQLLVGITDTDDKTIDIDAKLTWVLTISDGTTSKTITMSPATKALAYDLYRFETCLGAGDNQFVPVKGTDYTVTVKVYSGNVLAYESQPTAGFTCPMDPVVPGGDAPTPTPTPNPGDTVAIKITPKFGKWENWINSPNNPNGVGQEPGVTQLLVGITDTDDKTIDIDAKLTWVLTISDGTTSKTITMSPATKDLSYQLYRFETCFGVGDNQFVPVNGTNYTVTVKVYDGDVLAYESQPTAGFTCPMDPVVPGGDAPTPTPTPTPIPTPTPTVPTETPTETPVVGEIGGTFEGKNGETLTWKIDAETNTLIIDGEGEMPDFEPNNNPNNSNPTPWIDYVDTLYALRIRKGITYVGKNTASYSSIVEVYFSEGVEEIGMDAVAYCNQLTTVYLPKSLKKIGQGVVWASNAITATNYAGTAEEFAAIVKGNYNTKLDDTLVEEVAVPTGDATAILVVLAIVAMLGTAVVVSKKVFSR